MYKKVIILSILIIAGQQLLFQLWPQTYKLPGQGLFESWDGYRCVGYSYAKQQVPDGPAYAACIGWLEEMSWEEYLAESGR